VRGVNYVIHRGPLTSTGVGAAEGTVFTFQESRAVERLDRTLRSRQRPQQFSARYRLEDLVGESLPMERVRTLVRRYAKSDATVLVLGESGTGKEMVAQGMHQLSARRDFPFVAINCGAFPEALLESELFGYEEGAFTGARKGGKTGLIEAAHRGTLFLDEIGEMPLPLQSRLLRVLQEREVVRLGSTEPTRVDIRVMAATHRALTDAVEAGTFRADLYYRLNILSIALPPLRERPDDVMPLAAELLVQAARREPRLLLRIADTEEAARVLAGVAEPLRRFHLAAGDVDTLDQIAGHRAIRAEARRQRQQCVARAGQDQVRIFQRIERALRRIEMELLRRQAALLAVTPEAIALIQHRHLHAVRQRQRSIRARHHAAGGAIDHRAAGVDTPGLVKRQQRPCPASRQDRHGDGRLRMDHNLILILADIGRTEAVVEGRHSCLRGMRQD